MPPIKNSWSTGTILASLTSILSLLTVIGSIIWYSARVGYVVDNIPPTISNIKTRQESHDADIAVLKNQMQYTNVRYAEIQLELAKINDKLDGVRVRNGQ
jgi:hypothetical protein